MHGADQGPTNDATDVSGSAKHDRAVTRLTEV